MTLVKEVQDFFIGVAVSVVTASLVIGGIGGIEILIGIGDLQQVISFVLLMDVLFIPVHIFIGIKSAFGNSL